MSNLISNANMYDSLGEFTFVSAPKYLDIQLRIREPSHKAKFAVQSVSYTPSVALPKMIFETEGLCSATMSMSTVSTQMSKAKVKVVVI